LLTREVSTSRDTSQRILVRATTVERRGEERRGKERKGKERKGQ